MKCTSCEMEYDDGAERCPSCGTPVVQGIVTAAAAMASTGRYGGGEQGLAKRIEAAMSQAILDANAEGIGHNQPEVIKERMLAARAKTIQDAKAERAEADRLLAEQTAAQGNEPAVAQEGG